jgi:hypothetical protein
MLEPLDFVARLAGLVLFAIDVETWSKCDEDVRIIACIEDPAVIRKILAHFNDNVTSVAAGLLPDCRGPPTGPLFCSEEPNCS